MPEAHLHLLLLPDRPKSKHRRERMPENRPRPGGCASSPFTVSSSSTRKTTAEGFHGEGGDGTNVEGEKAGGKESSEGSVGINDIAGSCSGISACAAKETSAMGQASTGNRGVSTHIEMKNSGSANGNGLEGDGDTMSGTVTASPRDCATATCGHRASNGEANFGEALHWSGWGKGLKCCDGMAETSPHTQQQHVPAHGRRLIACEGEDLLHVNHLWSSSEAPSRAVCGFRSVAHSHKAWVLREQRGSLPLPHLLSRAVLRPIAHEWLPSHSWPCEALQSMSRAGAPL